MKACTLKRQPGFYLSLCHIPRDDDDVNCCLLLWIYCLPDCARCLTAIIHTFQTTLKVRMYEDPRFTDKRQAERGTGTYAEFRV